MVVKPAMSVTGCGLGRLARHSSRNPCALALTAQDGGGDALVDIATEGLADPFALAQAFDHGVEPAGGVRRLSSLEVTGTRTSRLPSATFAMALDRMAMGCSSERPT